MKKLALTLFLLSLSISVFSICAPKEIEFFPHTNAVSPNSLISIEGYGKVQGIVNELGELYPIYLKCGNFEIELELIENCVSQGGRTRVVFRPTSQWVAGGRHELVVENLKPKDKRLFERRNTNGEAFPISWGVTKNMDKSPPQWLQKPKLKDTFWIDYGCGPASYALFDYELKDDSQVLIKTEVLDLHTNDSTVYYLQREINDTQLKVGHEMCGGAFRFKKNHNYKVRFELMDACGNVTGVWTDWVEFESPENKAVW
ncbi:MAG: hypothetical protein AB8B69_18485 [Chitinophagales bacterium]